MQEFVDNNFIFDENGRKFSDPVENTVGKGDIKCLLLPLCFQKTCTANT